MIKLRISPRFLKAARKLPPELFEKTNEALIAAQTNFGNPHQHKGQSVRKLGRHSYEVRVGINLRIVLVLDDGELVAYDILNHEQVRQWLKERKGN